MIDDAEAKYFQMISIVLIRGWGRQIDYERRDIYTISITLNF